MMFPEFQKIIYTHLEQQRQQEIEQKWRMAGATPIKSGARISQLGQRLNEMFSYLELSRSHQDPFEKTCCA